ncbi:hypothetical protein B0O99DRAFT_686077 [Bisporella sp. PMI_857]|nr:hypothetical protein B0O99DRAFT_686077 [Bisporella sp. PMI_857]
MAAEISVLNDPPSLLGGPQLLHELLNFKKHGARNALDFTRNGKRERYSYREVSSCVELLKLRIQEALDGLTGNNLPSQHIIPILLPQSPGLYISQYAILKSGGAFCPINLDAPKERIKFVVGDISARIIITTTEFKELATWENGPKVIIVEDFPSKEQNISIIEDRCRKATSADLAYVMYTSGSSGTPKGVAVSHRAASQSLMAHDRHIPTFRRFLQFASPSFDVSVFEIFFPLTRGSTLVGCDRSQLLNDLPGIMNELEVDAAELTPTVVGSLLQKRSHVPGLKLLLTIGEMLTKPIIKEFGGSDTTRSILYGMYGPTEAAIHCTIHPEMKATARPVNIGFPLDTVSTFIASPAPEEAGFRFLPLGEVGELVLGGPQLADGYLNRPDQNRAAFIYFEGKQYYRTGDKARLLEDGTIEILGRMSSGQVKLRGQRIELGEIEDAIYKQPDVKTVVAVVLDNILVSFVLTSNLKLTSEAIATACADWLPKFMVPSEIILLSKFPYLPSGKVDRRQLEANYQRQREDSDSNSANNSSSSERAVKKVLEGILGPFSIGIRLPTIGLDSLSAIRVASSLRSLGYNVSTLDVLKSETVEELSHVCEKSKAAVDAKALDLARANSDQRAVVVLNGNAKDVESTMPCTPIQSAMLSETAREEKAYRNWVEFEIRGVDDLRQMSSALFDLAEHNPILRTGFIESTDSVGYTQVIWRRLLDSQIVEVNHFTYEYDTAHDSSLHRPIRFQIQQRESKIHVLIHLHHALYDAWSMELLLDDLDLILRDDSPPDRTPFRDLVDAYQTGVIITDSWASKDYWRDHLSELDFRQTPNFHSRKQLESSLAVVSKMTSISTVQVENFARAQSLSPQAIFQAAYALILGSYLGAEDICFGTVFSGRTLPVPGIETISGPCLSTLPIRVDISTSITVQDLVQNINATNRKHLEHGTVPLREIKLAAGVLPYQALFDTLLIWQQTLHSYDHTREHVLLSKSIDNLEFHLTLEVVPGVGNIELKANYQSSLFPKSQINLLLSQVEQMASLILKDRRTPIQGVFNQLEDTVLSIENEAPKVEVGDDTLVSPVERMAVNDPTRPAISFAHSIDGHLARIQTISYSELNCKANQLSYHLGSFSVLPNELVCIFMEKSIDLYISILATTKIGAGYIPVTPDTAVDRLHHIVQESKPKVIIAHTLSRPHLKSFHNFRIIYIDEVDLGNLSHLNLAPKFDSDNISYCVYTSGSTGTPKGVMVTQGNLLSNLEALEELYPIVEYPRLLQSCSQAFDVSVFEIFFTWRIGGCLCSAVKDVLFRDIENAIRVFGVTHLSLTPTVAALIEPDNVPTVKFLVTAGEAVTQRVFNSWNGRGLFQGYGPSETTNICSVRPNVSREDFINNIGPPFKNTSAFVLSPSSEFSLVPKGGEGEFCFGGSQVFRGYIDEKQEDGKIMQHPQYGRLYRSGDFGRLLSDGSLAFTGRKDDQVKIRGQRVELGEINNVMLRIPQVRDCTTIVIGKNGPSQRLICFWTSHSEISGDIQCLKPDPPIISFLYNVLETSLPSYMIPSALIPISYLPSTIQGKINKRLLEKQFANLNTRYLELTAQSSKSSVGHAWSNLELEVVKALAEVTNIHIDDIEVDTSFFSLGIDSISAISFARELRGRTKRPVEISDILRNPSVIRLGQKMLSLDHMISLPQSPKFDFGFSNDFRQSIIEEFHQAGQSVQNIFPCTPLQEAMLSAAESSSRRVYHNRVVFKVRGDVSNLKDCWREMVRRHEILRTCFVTTDISRYAFVQIVLERLELKFEASDEHQLPASQFVPPYTLEFIHSHKSTKLVLTMHHALYDGVALSLLYNEVESLMHGNSLSSAVSFGPFLDAMASSDVQQSDKYWDTVLENCSPTRLERLNASHMKNGEPEVKVRVQKITTLSPLSSITESIKKHKSSLLAVLHSIWASLLAELLEQNDICFGNVISGRTLPIEGVERLMAPCFNTLPTRVRNLHKLSFLETFREMQSMNSNSLQFQFTPLRRLQSRYSPDGSRLFDTLFILQQPHTDLDPSIWTIIEDDSAIDFPLVCEVLPKPDDDTLEILLHSHSSFFSEEDSQILLDSFDKTLRAALMNSRHQILSAQVKERIAAKVETRKESNPIITNLPSTPMSRTESNIRDVLSSFTNITPANISRNLSIFRLGLDSISTVQVAARLRKKGHSLSSGDILEHPTIAQLGEFLESNQSMPLNRDKHYDFANFEKKKRVAVCSKLNIDPDDVEAVRPCTAVQQGMIAQSLHSKGDVYINSMWLEISPNVSLSAFKSAWLTVAEGHEMLRTGFVPTDDPKHPFIMITYTKNHFPLPWYKFEEGCHMRKMLMDDIAHPPWSLSMHIGNENPIVQFSAHHALYDAYSLQMIFEDLVRAYNSKPLLYNCSIAPLLGSIQIEAGNVEEQKEFWTREENKIIVNRFPELTPLRVSGSENLIREVISEYSLSELDDYCQQANVTMQAATQTAWARLLTAYIGEVSTTFGMTLSGRSVHESAGAIAFPSIVTLPVRCDVVGTNQDLLARTMKANAAVQKYQFTPLTSVQKWAGYHGGHIFDTLFAYQKLPKHEDDIQSLWKVVQQEGSVDYSISLEVEPRRFNQLALRITFKENLIPSEHAELILKQYEALLLDTLLHPQNQCDVPLKLEPGLLSITPAKEVTLPDSATLLHEYLERGARNWPSRKAFEFATRLDPGHLESHSWTYKELDEEANKVAHLLLNHDVVSGEIIAICFDKCPEAFFAITGILKSGCSYVALDPTAPTQRLNFILKDSRAKLILTARKTTEKFTSNGFMVLALDAPELLANFPSTKPKLSMPISPCDVSYCLYTSGTTGTPKGCLITHENAVQAMLSFQRLFAGHWTPTSKWLQFASFHFDVSVLEIFWSWSVGICVASAPRDLIFEDIAGAIRELEITHIDLTPSLARLLTPRDVPSLCGGVFITGGEQLRQDILDAWGGVGCIYNGYGPTEATIGCTMYPRVPQNGKPANIGPQFDNVGSLVLKPGTDLPVLRGGVGELCVSGKLVGKGYLNRPDLTAERFPTLQFFKERVYRTGDLVRILYDGSFIFLGRADDQVKLRGQRLELSEINEVIKKSTEQLQEVVTLVLKHKTQQKEQLVSFFVVPSNTNDEDSKSLITLMREACKARLPGYMIPTHFIPIREVPLNANNKADSKQLATIYNELSADRLQVLSHSKQDRTWLDQERKIVSILAQALEVDTYDLTRASNIFELGLDSISIIGFSRILQNAGLKQAKLSIVKKNPSIGAMVKALLQTDSISHEIGNAYIAAAQNITAFSQKHMTDICNELEISSTEVECIAPCTPMQEGMIYQFLDSESPLYFNKFDFRLCNGVDSKKLLAALNTVVHKLQILRTKFVATDDGFAQVVLNELGVKVDSTLLEINQLSKPDALKTPFNVSLVSSPREETMSILIFHGLYDGNSLSMLLYRIIDEYERFKGREYGPSFHSSLPHGPLVRTPGAREFWTNHLRNWSNQKISTISKSIENIVATKVVTSLSGLESLRKRLSVLPQALIQASWLSVLQRISSQNMTIGIVTSGRAIDFKDAEKVIGPMFNTVPFSIQIEQNMTARSLILACHDYIMQMQDYQHTPLNDIQKWSPATPGEALFDTLFVFQRAEKRDEKYADSLWTQLSGNQIADYPLAFEATLNPDGRLNLTIVAQVSFITKETAVELLHQMEQTLSTIIEHSASNTIGGNSNIATTPKIPNGSGRVMPTVSTTYPGDVSQKALLNQTHEAKIIRTEIAILADINETMIKENSSIFELGLDSIDVIKLSSRLKRRNIKLPVSVIIRSQTIPNMLLQMSSKVEDDSYVESESTAQRLSKDITKYLEKQGAIPVDIEAVWPATPLQQSMVNEMLKSKYERYFNIEAFKLDMGVDMSKLKKAIEHVVQESPILRTSFVKIDHPRIPVSYAQVIHKKHIGITEASDQDVIRFLQHFRSNSISLAEKGSLFQVQFLSVGRGRYMVIAASHALYDGSSLRLLHQMIYDNYHGKLSISPDFVPFLNEVFKSTTNEAKTFWKNTLSNLPLAASPRKDASQIRDVDKVYRLERRSQLSLKGIEQVCKFQRITLQTLGQTCWTLVLAHLMGQLDVVFGSVLACRDSEEAEQLMFPLMNTVAIRSVVHGSLSEMLKYMQDMGDKIRQYQHFPLGTAQAYALASRGSGGDSTLFDTLFIYQGRCPLYQASKLYESIYGTAEVEFPTCVEMQIVDGEYLSWTTACKSIARNDIETEGIINMLDTVLRRIIENPNDSAFDSSEKGISICGLPSFQISERKEILMPIPELDNEMWNNTESIIRKALHELSDVEEEMIHKDSTIFQLGLDSILILKLPALLRSHSISLSVSEILRAQTVSAMAKSVHQDKVSESKLADVDAILPRETPSSSLYTTIEGFGLGKIQTVIPITAGQLHMIRMWQVSQGTLFYPTFIYMIIGQIDKEKLDWAWSLLLKRHDILRTGFFENDSKILQVVFEDPPNQVGSTDSGSLEISQTNPTDLVKPPLKLMVNTIDNKASQLRLKIHHALYDGISLPLLIDELQSLYLGQTTPGGPNLSLKTFIAQSISARESTEDKWKTYLEHRDFTKSPVPVTTASDFQRTEVFHASISLPPLKSFARSQGTTTDALLLAFLAQTYAKTASSSSSIVFGIYLANRSLAPTLPAPTLNILPLLVLSPLSRNVKEIAKCVQQDLQHVGSRDMIGASLDEIYKWTGVRVNCFVNILKETSTSTSSSEHNHLFTQATEEREKAAVVEYKPHFDAPADARCDAYLPSIEIEIRHRDDNADIGIFAPTSMLSVPEAEGMIESFVEIYVHAVS